MKIKSINTTGIILAIFVLLLSIILVLLVQNRKLEKQLFSNIEDISSNLHSHVESVDDYNQKINTLLIETQEKIEQIQDFQNNEFIQIKQDLNVIKYKSEAQFSKTVSMKKTYDDLLEEQKKKTVDTTAKDNSITQSRQKADEYYQKNEFLKAYELYKKVLEYQNDDMDTRMHKIKSLYYANKSDSSNYTEILEEINILKQNQMLDEECQEIEKSITMEKEGINE